MKMFWLVLKNIRQPCRMMSIFNISNTNGGIRDPVVYLKHERGINAIICLGLSNLLVIASFPHVIIYGWLFVAPEKRNR